MSLHKNTIANYLGQGWVAFTSLAFVPVYVDRLGVEAYGLIGFYAVLQAWFSLLDLGITPTITRETARFSSGSLAIESIRSLIHSLEIIVFTLALAIATGLWLASESIAKHWLTPESLSKETIAHSLGVISLVVGARFCEGIYRGMLFGLERQVFYNVALSALSTIRYGGAAILVSFIPSIEGFFWWQSVVSLLTVVVLARAAHAALPQSSQRYRFSYSELRRVGSFAAGMSLTAVFALLFTQVDKVILTRLVDLESFGLYTLALALCGVFPMLAGPAASAFFPRLSVVVAAGDHIAERDLFRQGTQIVSMLTVPAITLCIILGDEIVLGWTGNVVMAGKVGPILGFLAVGAFCNAALQVPFMVQLAHGWTTLSVRLNVCGVVLLSPMLYFGVEMWGLMGAAAAWGLTNIFVLLVATLVMHRRLLKNDLVFFLFQTLALPLVTSCLAVSLFTLIFQNSLNNRLESLMIVISSGLVALVATMFVLPAGRKLLKRLVSYYFVVDLPN